MSKNNVQMRDAFLGMLYQKAIGNPDIILLTNDQGAISLDDFKEKYYMLNCARQTRLLGRWVKLSKELNQSFYLGFIETTKKRLVKGIGNRTSEFVDRFLRDSVLVSIHTRNIGGDI